VYFNIIFLKKIIIYVLNIQEKIMNFWKWNMKEEEKIDVSIVDLLVENVRAIEENGIEFPFQSGITKQCIKEQLDQIVVQQWKKKATIIEIELTIHDTIRITYQCNKKIKLTDHSREAIVNEQEKILQDTKEVFRDMTQLKKEIEIVSTEFQENIDKGLEVYPDNQQAAPAYQNLETLNDKKSILHERIHQYVKNFVLRSFFGYIYNYFYKLYIYITQYIYI